MTKTCVMTSTTLKSDKIEGFGPVPSINPVLIRDTFKVLAFYEF